MNAPRLYFFRFSFNRRTAAGTLETWHAYTRAARNDAATRRQLAETVVRVTRPGEPYAPTAADLAHIGACAVRFDTVRASSGGNITATAPGAGSLHCAAVTVFYDENTRAAVYGEPAPAAA